MRTLFFAVLLCWLVSSARAADPAYQLSDALADAFSEPLSLIGKGRLYGYMSVDSCAFKNSKVIVVHGYCRNPEAPAGDIQIYSLADKQVVTIHAESTSNSTPISEANPKDYDPDFWYVSINPLPKDFTLDMSFNEFGTFYKTLHLSYPPYCVVSSKHSVCDKNLPEYESTWLPSANEFRKEPPKSWQQILVLMKGFVPKN